MQRSGNLSLYIHVPFCTRKCDYCHFYVIPYKQEWVTLYLEALALDIALSQKILEKDKIVSIYFGGGTPSLLSVKEIEQILSQLRPYIKEPIEITLEANPESMTKEKAAHLRTLGINRMSLGVQSFHNEELLLLGRQHGASLAEKAILAASEGGIENLSLDLIYDLPSQTKERFAKSVAKAAALPITHISLYNLTFEPHTLFYKKRKELSALVPDEESSLALFENAEYYLEDRGFIRYEISAFAKEGRESIHNSGYWTGRHYLGFGPSAHSFYEGVRFRKESHFHRWVKALQRNFSPIDFSEELPPSASLREKVAIGLRLFQGVELTPELYFPELLTLEKEGFISISDQRAFLTKRGKLFYDHVAEMLVEV